MERRLPRLLVETDIRSNCEVRVVKIPRLRTARERRRYVGGVAVDADRACLVVCEGPDGPTAGTLRFDRETLAGDVIGAMREAEELATIDGGGRIEWARTLGGGDVMHDVVTVPPQVRAFPDVRLDACLAATRWGNVEAVEAAGYRMGSTFDGDTCVLAVAPLSAVVAAEGARVTSSAYALAELLRAVEPDTFDRDAPASLAMLCERSKIAACVVESGELRLLHQTGLLAYFRELAPEARRPVSVPDGPLEVELGPSYAPARDAGPMRRVASERDLLDEDVESGAYQASAMKVLQEVLTLYREQYGSGAALPQRILLAGDAVGRHALHAFLVRYLGGQFEVDELDAALVVRVDDPEVARRFAALQSVYGGALAAVAVGMRRNVLEISTESADPEIAGATSVRRVAASGLSRSFATALAVAVLVGATAIGVRYYRLEREAAALAVGIETETNRQAELRALTERRKASEARLEHTRALLAALSELRGRQSVPPALLETIQSNLPSDTRLEEIALDGDVVRIVGAADDKEKGTLLALALERLDGTFDDVTPQTETKVETARDDDSGEMVTRTSYTFTITARYVGARKPAAQPAVKEV